jgi:hypothetical protein
MKIFLLACASLIMLVQSSAETPTGFLRGLEEFLNAYNSFENRIDTVIDTEEKQLLAKRMQNLAAGFYQLEQQKREFNQMIIDTPQLANQKLPPLAETISCLEENLTKTGLRMMHEGGDAVFENLRRGLDEKAATTKDWAVRLGVESMSESDAITRIRGESTKASELAHKLALRSMDFAKQLDPSSSPLEGQKCEFSNSN